MLWLENSSGQARSFLFYFGLRTMANELVASHSSMGHPDFVDERLWQLVLRDPLISGVEILSR